MAKKTELQKDITSKNDAELRTFIQTAREVLRTERFKDKFSRKAGLIRENRRQIARAQTELSARARTTDTTK